MHPAAQHHGRQQQRHAQVVKDVLGAVGARVPTQHGLQVGHAVDAAGVALLADDQHRHNQRNRLGDDGEVNTAHAPFEHGVADDEGQQGRHRNHGSDGKRQALERHPQRGQGRDLVPVHEVRNAGRGLDRSRDRVGRFQFEEHGHGVTAQTKEHALPQAEHAAITPYHHQSDGNKGIGQVLADQVESEDVQAQWQYHGQEHGEQHHAGELVALNPGFECIHGVGLLGRS